MKAHEHGRISAPMKASSCSQHCSAHLLLDLQQPRAQRAVADVLRHSCAAALVCHDAVEAHHAGVPQAGQLLSLLEHLHRVGVTPAGVEQLLQRHLHAAPLGQPHTAKAAAPQLFYLQAAPSLQCHSGELVWRLPSQHIHLGGMFSYWRMHWGHA